MPWSDYSSSLMTSPCLRRTTAFFQAARRPGIPRTCLTLPIMFCVLTDSTFTSKRVSTAFLISDLLVEGETRNTYWFAASRLSRDFWEKTGVPRMSLSGFILPSHLHQGLEGRGGENHAVGVHQRVGVNVLNALDVRVRQVAGREQQVRVGSIDD